MVGNSLAIYTPERQREVVELMGLKGSDTHISLLFQLAEHYSLDVKLKEITLIPSKGPFIGVWGRIHIAQRSGMLDGFEADDEWHTDGLYHVRCVVWRKDQSHPAAKVIGRVRDTERKDWPWEIARARALRAALGYAFNIHDSYDQTDEDWGPAPDERFQATTNGEEEPTGGARTIDVSTGEVHIQPETPTGPATVIVGGHTLAQKIAMAARTADIDEDELRHSIIDLATNGEYTRGSDIPEDAADSAVVKRIFEAFTGLADGSVELRYDPLRLVRPKRT